VSEMEYEPHLTDKAQLDFDRLDERFRAIVAGYIYKLAESPSHLSRRVVSPPYPPTFAMMREFDHGPVDGIIHHFTLFFRYGQDEQTIIIEGIGHLSYRDDPPAWNPPPLT
jgi:hypothetical protein